MDPFTISAIVGGAAAALQTGANGLGAALNRGTPKNPNYQTQVGIAGAARDSAYYNAFLPNALVMNNQAIEYQMESYKNMGLNPLLAVDNAVNPMSQMQMTPPDGSNSSVDLSSTLQPLMTFFSQFPQLLDKENRDLDTEAKRVAIQLKQQELRHKEELHEPTLEFSLLRNEELSQNIQEQRDTYDDRVTLMKQQIMSNKQRYRINELQYEHNKLLYDKEKAYSEYYKEVARLEKEGLERKNALAQAQESKAYSDILANQSKIALNNQKVANLQSDLESDPRNHLTANVDSIVDPEKHPFLNKVLKTGGLMYINKK